LRLEQSGLAIFALYLVCKISSIARWLKKVIFDEKVQMAKNTIIPQHQEVFDSVNNAPALLSKAMPSDTKAYLDNIKTALMQGEKSGFVNPFNRRKHLRRLRCRTF
jgi:hypothetical protein